VDWAILDITIAVGLLSKVRAVVSSDENSTCGYWSFLDSSAAACGGGAGPSSSSSSGSSSWTSTTRLLAFSSVLAMRWLTNFHVACHQVSRSEPSLNNLRDNLPQ
jgi:hypothetical protein